MTQGKFTKCVLTLLEADRVDNCLALDASQARLDDRPLGGVHHDGHPGDVRFSRNQVEERRHGLLGVKHGNVGLSVT